MRSLLSTREVAGARSRCRRPVWNLELNIKVSLDVSLRCDQEREHGYGGYRSGTPLCYYDNYYFYIRVNYDDIHVRTRSNLCP